MISIYGVFLLNLVLYNLFGLVFKYYIDQVAAFIGKYKMWLFCGGFHYHVEHLVWYSGNFSMNVCYELFNGLRVAGVHFAFQILHKKKSEGVKSRDLESWSCRPSLTSDFQGIFIAETGLFDLWTDIMSQYPPTSIPLTSSFSLKKKKNMIQWWFWRKRWSSHGRGMASRVDSLSPKCGNFAYVYRQSLKWVRRA